jgi:hypothetical protein
MDVEYQDSLTQITSPAGNIRAIFKVPFHILWSQKKKKRIMLKYINSLSCVHTRMSRKPLQFPKSKIETKLMSKTQTTLDHMTYDSKKYKIKSLGICV